MKLLFLLLIGFPLFSQELPASLPVPLPLETSHVLGKGLPLGQPPIALNDLFFALAWSAEGHFASLVKRTMPGRTPEAIFSIQDLVEDTTVHEEQLPVWQKDDDFPVWWSAQQAHFRNLYKEYHLFPIDYQLGFFPAILDEEYYTMQLRSPKISRDSAWISTFQVAVHSTGRGTKTVLDLPGPWRWGRVLGFVPSPFEDRLAFLILAQPVGWMGEKQPLRYYVTGVSLKAGFTLP